MSSTAIKLEWTRGNSLLAASGTIISPNLAQGESRLVYVSHPLVSFALPADPSFIVQAGPDPMRVRVVCAAKVDGVWRTTNGAGFIIELDWPTGAYYETTTANVQLTWTRVGVSA